MALETVVYPQDQFGYGCKEFYNLVGGAAGWGFDDFGFQEEDKALVEILDSNMDHGLNGNWDTSSSPGDHLLGERSPPREEQAATKPPSRLKRRRTKSSKNKEELENQRMTHITVERNRRKQMNEYLSIIRSLMPPSYVQRGDQASIIGGAINFVKELEQLLQTLEAKKRTTTQAPNNGFSPLFADFFTFPQYSTHRNNSPATAEKPMAENWSALADIEVTMVESHANLKILSKRRPRQLLKMVAGLQFLRLALLHINVTTVDQMVLYSLSVKVY